jgi:hypothetical protein
MSHANKSQSGRVNVAFIVVIALGPIFGAIVAELLEHWPKRSRNSSKAPGVETGLSRDDASAGVPQIRERIEKLESNLAALSVPCRNATQEQIDSGDPARDGDAPSG